MVFEGGLEKISALEYPDSVEDAATVDRNRRERYSNDNAAAFNKDYDKAVAALEIATQEDHTR